MRPAPQRKNLASGHGKWVRDSADVLSSVAFGFANVVTIMFHLVRISQGHDGAVEGGDIERPPWLGFTVHNLNSMVAWVHLLLSPHSFSPLAEKLSLVLVLAYNALILACSYANGSFPYPFLNNLPFPWGFMCVSLIASLVFASAFRVGKLIKGCIGWDSATPAGAKAD